MTPTNTTTTTPPTNSVIPATKSETTISEHIDHNLSKLLDMSNVDAVFGRPIERGTTVIIPCSEVQAGLGLGGGAGSAPSPRSDKPIVGGEGYGGGGGVKGRPVAVIIITPDQVRIKPVIDTTRVILTALASGTATVIALTPFLRFLLRRNLGKHS